MANFEGESDEPYDLRAEESDTEGEPDEQYGGSEGNPVVSDTEGEPDEQHGA